MYIFNKFLQYRTADFVFYLLTDEILIVLAQSLIFDSKFRY